MRILLVLAALVLAGCAAPAAGPAAVDVGTGLTVGPPAPLTAPLRILDDARGDATEYNSDQVGQVARQACSAAPFQNAPTCRALVPPSRTGGTPAPPALDIVSLDVQESADTLVFRLGLASLSGDPAEFLDPTGVYGAGFHVWLTSGAACLSLLSFEVTPLSGALFAEADHLRTHDDCEPKQDDPLQGACATVNPCYARANWTIEPGAPGFLVLSVPRAQTALVAASTEVSVFVQALRLTGYGNPGGWAQPGTALGSDQFSFDRRLQNYIVDDTDEARFTLTTEGDPHAWGTPASTTLVEPVSGRVADGDLDVQQVLLEDDPRNFTITLTLRELPEAPADLGFLLQFTTPGKHHYFLVATGDGGAWNITTAARWLADRAVPISARIEAAPGAPGEIRLTIPRSDLPGTAAGSLMRGLWGAVYRSTEHTDADGRFGTTYVTAFTDSGYLFTTELYQFSTAPAQVVAVPAIEVLDAVGDTQPPPDARADPAFRASSFDLSYATLRATPDQRVQLDLGVVGLDALAAPTLYDGVFYGAGIQTERAAWMIAVQYDKATGVPTAQCGADVAFLTPDPKPPGASTGAPVSFTLLPASGDASGLLSFDVPPACLGIDTARGEFAITRLVARAGIIGGSGSGTAPVTVLDETFDLEGGLLVFPASSVSRSPWAEPFGIQNFWDIFGVALAIVLAILTGVAVLEKRLRMKRYLIELESLGDRLHDEPTRYAQELVELRGRLFGDLLKNRVTEGHFVMIEERLRGHLSSTRINAFGRAFYHLPPAFMIRLQTLLADGRFSAQDHRALHELLGEIALPDESREAVRAQIDLWATQDQSVARMLRTARARRGWRGLLARARPAEETAET